MVLLLFIILNSIFQFTMVQKMCYIQVHFLNEGLFSLKFFLKNLGFVLSIIYKREEYLVIKLFQILF
jgi:hypothetical protein